MSKEHAESMFAELDELSDCCNLEEINKCLEEVEKLEKSFEKMFDRMHPFVQCGFLRRKAEYFYLKSNYLKTKEERVGMLEKAFGIAKQGHEIDEDDFDCCKILCSTCGRLAEESGLKQKLHYGFLFKKYLDKAISIDDEDFETLHMRGRFCFTVADLSMVERLAAKVIGQIPNVTYQNAIDDLLKAEGHHPNVPENQLFIGKTYFAMGKYQEAKRWLQSTADSISDIALENEYIAEAQELLKNRKLK